MTSNLLKVEIQGDFGNGRINSFRSKISNFKIKDEDYISITDMLKSKDGDFFVSDWLKNRNKSTVCDLLYI